MFKQLYFILVLSFAASLSSPLIANNSLLPGSLFTNGMVLQSHMKVPVWGTAKPGTLIDVQFAGQQKSTTADATGHWMLKLDSLDVNVQPETMSISSTLNQDTEKIQLSNVLVGEVWICSGQSNMQFTYGSVPEIKALVPSAQHIRTFNVRRTVALTEQDTCDGEWQDEIPNSAVAFSFAYYLQKSTDIPVGIILNPWGSSSIEAWMPRDMTDDVPHFKTMMDQFDANTEFQDRITSIIEGPKPWSKNDDIFLRRQSNVLYNAMMSPLAPYACKGFVWYQGERNTQSMYGEITDPWWSQNSGMLKYGETLKQWILRYREEWKQDDLQFLVVMLPGYAKGFVEEADNPDTTSWAWMRESQLKALELPHTSVINTIDLGDVKNVHPKDKQPVGKRLALAAQRDVYHQDVIADGPIFASIEKHRKTLILHYTSADGLSTTDGEAPSGFWLSNEKGVWYPAIAKIKDETVILCCKELKKPLYVRYAFAGKPVVNLINNAELPAYPFRTDTFRP